MKVEFLSKFSKDIDEINQASVKKSLKKLIEEVDRIADICKLPNVKKLQGFKNAYRIRLGNYRVGIFVEGDVVQFARVKSRKDIYRIFP
jgi:Cytotoxic translational repressor of toxin-antitoxin stability system